MPISPLGGVTSQIYWRILKGNCRLPISGLLQQLLYYAPFPSYKRFYGFLFIKPEVS